MSKQRKQQAPAETAGTPWACECGSRLPAVRYGERVTGYHVSEFRSECQACGRTWNGTIEMAPYGPGWDAYRYVSLGLNAWRVG